MNPCSDSDKVLLQAISDPKRILQIEQQLNDIVNRSCDTPFVFSGFIKEFMEYSRSIGWSPLVLVVSVGSRIIGCAPLMVKRKFGFRFVNLVIFPWTSADFVVLDGYASVFFDSVINYLFKHLKCSFVNLITLETALVDRLKLSCALKNVHFSMKLDVWHYVINIKSDWSSFEASRTRNFRYKFRRLKRKLDAAGAWRIFSLDGKDCAPEITSRILEVERTSWKSQWRAQRNEETDQQLLRLLAAATHTVSVEPAFKWRTWFLELNGATVAYCFLVFFKKTAYFTKTSYNNSLSKLYIGVFLHNAAIKEFFDSGELNRIDFLTDLPVFQTWDSEDLPRVSIKLTKGFVPRIIRLAFENVCLKRIILKITSLVPVKIQGNWLQLYV